ncbi:C40 family peptidase [Desulfitobacterium metallireducens]|uniref:Hydrolase n=1 Tax=Desulfitobacterium metallireducens DSM 15288 TaxID=871968 RepID=W0EA76_9FIRM|nr:NlpC/P60 family protein [Desulfitobacterium metallireducens]AHF06433.1 hydrolase [Desulfitobacterium metallireducens DSM 15288]
MKKRLILFAVLIMLSVLAITPTAHAATLLKVGTRDSSVQALQSDLKTLGYNPGPVDGIYGIKTKTAVQAFQQSAKLQADGIYGPLTEQALTRALKTQQILSTAQNYTGAPYLWGGNTPSGFDCSGFTQYVFAKNGITLPRVSRDQYNIGTPVRFNALQPGDLVIFSFLSSGQVSHVGIYIGDNQFLSATTSKGVIISSFSPYWKNAYIGAKRVY